MGYHNGQKVDITYTSDMNVETFRNKVSNAIVETATGTNAVKISDINTLSNKLDVSIKAANLINQEEFFKTNSFEIKGEIGKTYIFSCIFKSGANIDDAVVSGIYDFFGNEMSNSNFVTNDEPLQVTITEGHEYKWITENANASDIFESVSMVLTDVSDITFKSYGKNLLNINTEWGTEGSYRTIDIPVPCDVTISYERKTAQNYYSVMRSNNGKWTTGNRELVGYLGTPTGAGTGAQQTSKNSLEIPKKDGYKYKLFTNEDILTNNRFDANKNLVWMQVEVGAASEHEAYKEPTEGVLMVYPTTTLIADTDGAQITATWSKDINKVYQAQQDEMKKLKDENLQQQDEIKKLKNAILNMGGTIWVTSGIINGYKTGEMSFAKTTELTANYLAKGIITQEQAERIMTECPMPTMEEV